MRNRGRQPVNRIHQGIPLLMENPTDHEAKAAPTPYIVCSADSIRPCLASGDPPTTRMLDRLPSIETSDPEKTASTISIVKLLTTGAIAQVTTPIAARMMTTRSTANLLLSQIIRIVENPAARLPSARNQPESPKSSPNSRASGGSNGPRMMS